MRRVVASIAPFRGHQGRLGCGRRRLRRDATDALPPVKLKGLFELLSAVAER
jgi:hypothetical protein